jgi:hypothetical protein
VGDGKLVICRSQVKTICLLSCSLPLSLLVFSSSRFYTYFFHLLPIYIRSLFITATSFMKFLFIFLVLLTLIPRNKPILLGLQFAAWLLSGHPPSLLGTCLLTFLPLLPTRRLPYIIRLLVSFSLFLPLRRGAE